MKYDVERKVNSKAVLKKDVEILRQLVPGAEDEIAAERVSPIIAHLVSSPVL